MIENLFESAESILLWSPYLTAVLVVAGSSAMVLAASISLSMMNLVSGDPREPRMEPYGNEKAVHVPCKLKFDVEMTANDSAKFANSDPEAVQVARLWNVDVQDEFFQKLKHRPSLCKLLQKIRTQRPEIRRIALTRQGVYLSGRQGAEMGAEIGAMAKELANALFQSFGRSKKITWKERYWDWHDLSLMMCPLWMLAVFTTVPANVPIYDNTDWIFTRGWGAAFFMAFCLIFAVVFARKIESKIFVAYLAPLTLMALYGTNDVAYHLNSLIGWDEVSESTELSDAYLNSIPRKFRTSHFNHYIIVSDRKVPHPQGLPTEIEVPAKLMSKIAHTDIKLESKTGMHKIETFTGSDGSPIRTKDAAVDYTWKTGILGLPFITEIAVRKK